jgi:hypothetical protein
MQILRRLCWMRWSQHWNWELVNNLL